MAISIVSGNKGALTNGGDVSLTLASALEGDLVIVATVIPRASDLDMVMLSTGYTEVADLYSNSGTRDCNFGVFYKFMGATPDSTVQMEGYGNANDGVCMAYLMFRGVALVADGGPFDVASTTATGIDTTAADPPSIDWSTSGVWTVIAVGSAHGGGTDTYTAPTGYTTDWQTTGGNDVDDSSVGLGYNSAPSDPENVGALTHSQAAAAGQAWCAVTMALKPAGAGGAAGSLVVPRTAVARHVVTTTWDKWG